MYFFQCPAGILKSKLQLFSSPRFYLFLCVCMHVRGKWRVESGENQKKVNLQLCFMCLPSPLCAYVCVCENT